MGVSRAGLVQQRQAPLRERYRSDPAAARITDCAHTINACGGDAFHGVVVPANGAEAPLCFGIHRAVGGFHDYPNPGDLLSAALAACFDSTLRMIAEHLGVRVATLDVNVEAECDVRGCLLVEPAVSVGFQRMRCRVRLATQDAVDERTLQKLIAAAENSCVVMQTLRHGVTVETEIEESAAVTASTTGAG